MEDDAEAAGLLTAAVGRPGQLGDARPANEQTGRVLFFFKQQALKFPSLSSTKSWLGKLLAAAQWLKST